MAHRARGADIEDCSQELWTAVALKLADFKHPHESLSIGAPAKMTVKTSQDYRLADAHPQGRP